MPESDQTTTSLTVIDATLAGEAVAPEYAELAELTLILAGQRPIPDPTFTARLDQRVAHRFGPEPAEPASSRRPTAPWWRRGLYAPGAALALAAVAVAIVVALPGGGGSDTASTASTAGSAADASTSSAAASSPARGPDAAALPKAASGAAAGAASGSVSPLSRAATAATGHRQVIQSAQLALSTRPSNVQPLAQQVFNVVAAQGGFVVSSNVTATGSPSGYGEFVLSVPSASLSATMGALSHLRDASVTSRNDATQDVTGQLGGDGQRLAEARALRTSLLRQLANAVTTTQVDSLKLQIHDADASIASDLATLRGLQHQVAFSRVSLTINASLVPVRHHSAGVAFGLRQGLHDAGRVLVVAAGVVLIALAVLVPVGLLAALTVWLGTLTRRRRREHALDLI